MKRSASDAHPHFERGVSADAIEKKTLRMSEGLSLSRVFPMCHMSLRYIAVSSSLLQIAGTG